MNENMDDILERIDDIIDKAPSVPFSGKKVMVDAEEIHDLINEIRLNMPQEIKHAKLIVMDRQTIVNDANKEAEHIIKRAEDRAKSIIANDEIVKAAKTRANEIMVHAQKKAKEVQNATNEYVDNVLNQTEEVLANNLVDVKKTRQAIRSTSKIK